jgi:hypothetical protein
MKSMFELYDDMATINTACAQAQRSQFGLENKIVKRSKLVERINYNVDEVLQKCSTNLPISELRLQCFIFHTHIHIT